MLWQSDHHCHGSSLAESSNSERYVATGFLYCLRALMTTQTQKLTQVYFIPDRNNEETAIAAYWITDGVDRCQVGFLPRHCIHQARNFDGCIVQVVAFLLAQSENASERRHSRNNRGWCSICKHNRFQSFKSHYTFE
jgi:hypothetical protein